MTYRLDDAVGRRRFSRAAVDYDNVAVLQELVRRELLGRLDVVQLAPTTVLDLGCGTGAGMEVLLGRYAPQTTWTARAKARMGLAAPIPAARVIGVDYARGMAAVAAMRTQGHAGATVLVADACRLPLPAACADLVFSSLLLPWIANPDRLFAEVHRVLRPGGLFAFATLGPDSLRELRGASRTVDDAPRVLEFADMPELARGLQQAGFADPVLDRDLHQLSYSGAAALFADLRALGATNRRQDRARGLTGRGRMAALGAACDACRSEDGRLRMTGEVIYGHAWIPAGAAVRGKRSGTGDEVVVPLSNLQRLPARQRET